ncbi:MAG: aminotransferase class IV, partial [Hyphomicrobiales bacterium]|nr:aminotransferase class IV [Hyphomicrobiales bacterium]
MAEKPYDRLDGVIWYDGKLVPWGEATLHVLSHGLHYASSVFEGERAYGGEIFKCTEHSQRLKRSAELLDFDIPYSVAEIDAAKRLVLEKNGQSDAYVRPVSWRGSEMMGVSAQHNKIHLAIATWQWPSYFDPVQRLKGIRLDLADYRRPDPKTAPTRAKAVGLYMICTISKHIAERNGQPDAYVRPVAWRGSEQLGVSAQHNKIHLAIATWEWPSYFDPAQRMKGIRLEMAEYRRPDPATAPALAKAAGLYMICTISKHRAERRGFADALMLDWQGRVAECTGANVFFVKDGAIHTPIADCFLAGITRAAVIDLARRRGFEVVERRILPDELKS